jgi:hypothetical protein
MRQECYFAVEIGTYPMDEPYFMLDADKKTPALFITREEAETNRPKHHFAKVVFVEVKEVLTKKLPKKRRATR